MLFRSRRKAGGERGTGNDVFKIQVPRLRNTDGEAGNPVEGMDMRIMLPCEECRTMAVGKSVEKGTEQKTRNAFDQMNNVVARFLLDLTAGSRFSGKLITLIKI